MNAPIVHIQYDQVRQVAQRFHRQGAAIQSIHQVVLQTYQHLTSGAWQGEAAQRFAAEMQSEVFPALRRAAQVFTAAQAVTMELVHTFDAAEQEAARLFQGELHDIAVGGSSGGFAAEAGGLRQSTSSTTTFVAFTPTPTPEDDASTPPPLSSAIDESVQRITVLADILRILVDRGIPGQPNGSDYGIDTLPLAAMTLDDLTRLKAILESDSPQLVIDDALGLIDQLQTYWGYDTMTMVQALRELYYPSALDPFIMGAGSINETILQFTPNPNDPNATSQAAFAYTLLQLSRQRTGYIPAIVPITRDGVDNGFDHVVAALDAYYHPTTEPQSTLVDWGLNLFGLHTIQPLEAVTWQGDLGGSVHQGLNAALEIFTNDAGYPDLERCLALDPYEWTALGYCTEMPDEDIEGDVMGIVVTSHADALGLTTGASLGTALSQAYDRHGS